MADLTYYRSRRNKNNKTDITKYNTELEGHWNEVFYVFFNTYREANSKRVLSDIYCYNKEKNGIM